MRRISRFINRTVHRFSTRDELRRERDGRPSGKAGAPGAGGGGGSAGEAIGLLLVLTKAS